MDTRGLYGRGRGGVKVGRVGSDLEVGGLPIEVFDKEVEGFSGFFDSVGHPALAVGVIQVIPNLNQGFLGFNEGFEGFVGCFHRWCSGYRLVLTIRRRGCQGSQG